MKGRWVGVAWPVPLLRKPCSLVFFPGRQLPPSVTPAFYSRYPSAPTRFVSSFKVASTGRKLCLFVGSATGPGLNRRDCALGGWGDDTVESDSPPLGHAEPCYFRKGTLPEQRWVEAMVKKPSLVKVMQSVRSVNGLPATYGREYHAIHNASVHSLPGGFGMCPSVASFMTNVQEIRPARPPHVCASQRHLPLRHWHRWLHVERTPCPEQ